MKKKVFALTLVLMMVLFSGCMRFSVEMDFSSDGKVDVSMIYAMSDELSSFMSDSDSSDSEGTSDTGLSAEEISELEDEGWEYAAYSEDGFSGYKITSRGNDISEITTKFSDAEGSTGLGSEDISLTSDGNGNYVLDWKILDEETDSEVADMGEYFDEYNGYMQFVLTVPQGTTANNATTVSDDGNTLTWNLLENDTIHAEFTIPNAGSASGGNAGLIIGAIVIAIIVIAVVVVLSRKNKGQAAPAAEAPAPAPAEPTMAETTESEENKTE